jgi:trk system potassium uptake protein TrkA
MYIIVVGGGRLGYYLTKELLAEEHEVLIIEKDAAISQTISSELGSVSLRGDGCEVATLVQAGTSRADIFISVTGEDEDNLVACQVAKHKFNVPRTIARVRNPKNAALFKELGVDVCVSSTAIILEHIKHEMPFHPLIHLMTIQENGLDIIEVTVPEGSAAVGKQVNQLALPPDSVLSLIIGPDKKPAVPASETVIQAGDRIIAVALPESMDALRSALTAG